MKTIYKIWKVCALTKLPGKYQTASQVICSQSKIPSRRMLYWKPQARNCFFYHRIHQLSCGGLITPSKTLADLVAQAFAVLDSCSTTMPKNYLQELLALLFCKNLLTQIYKKNMKSVSQFEWWKWSLIVSLQTKQSVRLKK